MATIYLAMGARHRFTLPSGDILAMSKSAQGLIDLGYPAADFNTTDGTLVEQDDQASEWNADVAPGWIRSGGEYYSSPPTTDGDLVEAAVGRWYESWHAWRSGLDVASAGQDRSLVQIGHDYLWRAAGGVYIIATDTSRSAAERVAIIDTARFGAADVQTVIQFYNSFSGGPGHTATNWVIWVDLSSLTDLSNIPRHNLIDSEIVSGSVPDSVDLSTSAWSAGIAS